MMNDKDFNAFVDSLQDEIFAEAKSALGEKGFDRWRSPRFCGRMEDADAHARLTGSCGDTMEMYIKVLEDKVASVSYVTDGCSSSSVAGSFAAELASWRTFEQIFDMTGADVLKEIGTFPKEEEHCAYLAVQTLQNALNDYLVDQVKKSKEAG